MYERRASIKASAIEAWKRITRAQIQEVHCQLWVCTSLETVGVPSISEA